MRFYDRVAELTLHLAEHPSVNGSQGEADILEDAYGMLSRLPTQERLRVFRGEDASGRPAFVLAHCRLRGPRPMKPRRSTLSDADSDLESPLQGTPAL